ncbi:MAG: ribosome biogenesis GTPase YlqF [Firmicutes bacterium]|nr:ribosome biogenesis GTPase YlqF [Bacillota bacterium]
MEVQWYPGHMVKAKQLIQENLKLVDLVIELVDARIPASSRNPDLERLVGNKPRMLIMNKEDLADPIKTGAWCNYFKRQGLPTVVVNSLIGSGLRQVSTTANHLAEEKMRALMAKGRRPRAVRVMVVGIPNVGKSAFINALTGRSVTQTGDKPGVTRGKQWIRLSDDLELLDTPGILWPKFDDPEVGFKLAVTGAVSDLVYDVEEVGLQLIDLLSRIAPQAILERYRLAEVKEDPRETLLEIGRRRGFLQTGGVVDSVKSAYLILQEFREGKMGRITLDDVPKIEPAIYNPEEY